MTDTGTLEEYLEYMRWHWQEACSDDHNGQHIEHLLNMTSKYREALERVRQKTGDAGYDGGDSGVHVIVCCALAFDPRV